MEQRNIIIDNDTVGLSFLHPYFNTILVNHLFILFIL